MKTMYPKDEIQKTIEEVLRQGYKAAPGTYSLEEFFHDYGDELLEGLTARAEYNDSAEDGELQEDLYQKWHVVLEKIVPLLYEAVIDDLDWVRENNYDIVRDVLQG